MKLNTVLLGLVVLLNSTAALADYPVYQKSKLSEQSIQTIGSDSMTELLVALATEYRKSQPKVKVEILPRGSASAPRALADGRAHLGPMARPMREAELEMFKQQTGRQPTRIKTATAATAIYVSQQNPLQQITFEELDAIYSADLKRSTGEPVANWSSLNAKLNAKFDNDKIMPVAYASNSYHSSYFKQQVLLQGTYAKHVRLAGSARGVAELLRANPGAIAFGPIGLEKFEGVKQLKISRLGDEYFAANQTNISSGDYPLSRYLNLYIDLGPAHRKAAIDLVNFVLSSKGQEVARRAGYLRLTEEEASEELAKLSSK